MNPKKKILVSYATAGIGHKKAAMAVEEALRKYPDLEVTNIDVLDYTNAFFKWSYPNGYLLLINKLILLWGLLYYFFDFKLVHTLCKGSRKWYHVINSLRLVKFIVEYKPDVILSAHFLMPDVCAYVKDKYKLNMTVINIVTDYRAHAFWISDGVDKYAVAHEETKNDLVVKWGIDPKDVIITGIPVGSRFEAAHDRDKMRSKYGIKADNFTLLILSGGYGVGPILETVKLLDTLDSSLTIITVCGHNKTLFSQIEEFRKTAKVDIKNFGYVDIVDELMAASDIYIGKAGGISTAEALSLGLPLIYINPIPGQESRNARFVEKRGGAKILKNYKQVLPVIRELMDDRAKTGTMAKAAGDTGKKDAAETIARLAYETDRSNTRA